MRLKVTIITIGYITLFLLLTFLLAPLNKEYILIQDSGNITMHSQLYYSSVKDISTLYKSIDEYTIKTEIESKSKLSKSTIAQTSNYVVVTLNKTLYLAQIGVLTVVYMMLIFILDRHSVN
ncbi:hypothetical protein EZV73_26540 [Acidaminobacter sp. JC074]|uniref:hypothetical protein n=1 Tax=Acidaminobacter sp. JC074 TaxID=2530199 RepID=UPI001F10836C|nr:hypothetical protein [Acidaminobacter sp. JC074]MCH4891165.1 hypothetical protein [Acidaminobacter sp. JC074]